MSTEGRDVLVTSLLVIIAPAACDAGDDLGCSVYHADAVVISVGYINIPRSISKNPSWFTEFGTDGRSAVS